MERLISKFVKINIVYYMVRTSIASKKVDSKTKPDSLDLLGLVSGEDLIRADAMHEV